MNLEALRDYCLAKPGTTESLPFDADTLVFKVMGKMFCLTNLEQYDGINVKCDPEVAMELRERYQSVLPGYHMDKKHWNTIKLTGELSPKQLKHWINHSYELVVSKLPKRDREALKALDNKAEDV